MPEVKGGRISVAIFFWPSPECVKESFQTVRGDARLKEEIEQEALEDAPGGAYDGDANPSAVHIDVSKFGGRPRVKESF